jgi:uncharacterized protein YdhG (YjbR/CyaY superfamily)
VATGTAKKRVAKTAPASTVDDYLAAAPKDKRAALRTLRKTIKAAAPKATEGISYGMPTFKYKGERLVYFAYWKDHYGLYGIGRSVVDAHVAELRAYPQSKGTIQFRADQPLPERLITRVVKARLAQIDKSG